MSRIEPYQPLPEQSDGSRQGMPADVAVILVRHQGREVAIRIDNPEVVLGADYEYEESGTDWYVMERRRIRATYTVTVTGNNMTKINKNTQDEKRDGSE